MDSAALAPSGTNGYCIVRVCKCNNQTLAMGGRDVVGCDLLTLLVPWSITTDHIYTGLWCAFLARAFARGVSL